MCYLVLTDEAEFQNEEDNNAKEKAYYRRDRFEGGPMRIDESPHIVADIIDHFNSRRIPPILRGFKGSVIFDQTIIEHFGFDNFQSTIERCVTSNEFGR